MFVADSNGTSAGNGMAGRAVQPEPGKPAAPKRLGDQLLDQGIITRDQLEIALAEQKQSKGFLGEVLVTLGFVDQELLTSLIANQSGVESFDAATSLVDPEAVRLIPKDTAANCRAVPFSLVENELHVAMVDPQDVLALDQLQRYVPGAVTIVPRLCNAGQINDLIDRAYSYELSIDGILKELETGEFDVQASIDDSATGFRHPLVRLVDAILFDAVKVGASDIHFEPEAMFLRLRYRIDGAMTQIRNFRKDHLSPISHRLKIMANMNIADRLTAQDGRFELRLGRRQIDYRVSSLPTVHGENIVMRILDQSGAHLSIEQLGLTPHNRRLVERILMRPEGLIIATGPTGSGKTTTLYSMLSRISTPDVNVMTLEDPVEYQMPLVRQTQIREASGLDFASGVRALLRQDPDIVMVGEIRDHDTAIMAMRAAMTGHKVFSTLHTNDAIGAIARLVDLGIQPGVLAGNVIACIGQRLARRLCQHCRRERPASEHECHMFGIAPASPATTASPSSAPFETGSGPAATAVAGSTDGPPTVFEAVGCEHCRGSGYRGRVSLMEILPFDEDLDEAVARGANRSEIRAMAVERGFRSMREDGIERVLAGEISTESLVATVDMSARIA
ncbi:MAG: ATPase, T2SS/T4P/T4SS family [Geminicoccaceae bacterium]